MSGDDREWNDCANYINSLRPSDVFTEEVIRAGARELGFQQNVHRIWAGPRFYCVFGAKPSPFGERVGRW